jgi:predicted Zn-dependent protease
MRYGVLTLLFCLIVAGCATTRLPPVTTGGFTFEDDEKRLWLRSEEEQEVLNSSGLLYEDEELEVYLNEIAKKIQPPEVLEHIPFKVKVIENPHLNAFAYPNGTLYVHTGILARMENEAQLVTLLAHEMAHCTHRHALRQFRSTKNMTAFLATVQVTVGGLGYGIGDLATLLGAVGTLAAVTGYSRESETEADMEGMKRIVEAGYDPEEAPKLFIHLKKELEEDKRKEPFFFGTHPRLKERIKNYETFLKTEYQGKLEGMKNSEIFLEKIHRVIFENACLDLKVGRFKVAQRGAKKYLTMRPNDPKAYCVLGEICRQRREEGDTKKAKEHYQKAISIDQSYPDAHKGIGLIYYKEGERTLAKKSLELYLSLSPQASDRAYVEEYIEKLQ